MRRRHGMALLAGTMVLALTGCGGGDKGGDGAAGPTIGGPTIGGPTIGGHVLGDQAIRAAEVVARTDASRQPLDAAPSPDGTVIYYSATGDPGPALFSVPAAGGTVSILAEGASLGTPSGVAVATDGSRVYVADASRSILAVPATGAPGTPTPVVGTEGRSPRGLDVVGQGGADVIWFTGTDPATGTPGLFTVPAAGGTVATVAEGAPFASPDSVVVAANGVAYVTDQGTGAGEGNVFRVGDGRVTPVLTELHLGTPAGVTLVNDDSTLLVSSIDPVTRSDQVLFLDLATGSTAAATKVIGTNKDSAGGLHRAHDVPGLAWADVSRGGRVYRVEL